MNIWGWMDWSPKGVEELLKKLDKYRHSKTRDDGHREVIEIEI